jgi:hypothetical protein
MSYAMLWIESLAAALLLVATAAAVVARWPFRWLRLAAMVLVALPLFALAAAATYGIGFLRYSANLELNWFVPALTWTGVFAVGALVLISYGTGGSGDAPRRASSWPRGALALGFTAAAILLYLTYANLDLAMKMQQASLRAEAGAKLLALTPPRPPDADNAALVYQEAFDNLTPREQLPPAWKAKADDWFDRAHKPLDPQDKDLRDYLASQARALELLHKAAAMPRCAFERDYTEHISMPLPELEKLRHAAALLSLHAAARAADGDLGGALSDVDALFGVARHADEPTLVCVVNALWIEELAVRTLEAVLTLGTPKPEQLAALPLAEPGSHRRSVARAIQMEEAVFGLAIFGLLGEDPDLSRAAGEAFGGCGWPPSGPALSLWRVFHMPDDLAAYRRLMTRMRHLAERPYYEAQPDWEKLARELRDRRPGVATALLVPAAWRVAVRAAEADAHRRLARVAAAAVLFKAKNGKYPKKMEELTPAFLPQPPLDPFTGKALRLWPDGDGLVLSCTCPELPKELWGERKQPGEVTFRLK